MRFLLSPAWPFVVLALLCASCSDDSAKDPVMVAAPLSFSPENADLGSVTFGARTSTIYTLKNTSDKPLVISRIGPFACQCVSAELILPQRSGDARKRRLKGDRLDLELAAGEVAEVHFVLDTSRYRQPASRKIGSFPIVFRDHPGIVLQWGADIWTPFAVEPWAVELGQVGIRSRPVGTALVVGHDTFHFTLDVDFEQHGWQVKSKRIALVETDRTTYEISFTAPEYLPEGPFHEEFRMFTDLPDAPAITVAVQGLAQADLFFSPTRLLFDPQRNIRTVPFMIAQRAAGQDLSKLIYDDFSKHSISVTAGKAMPLDQQNGIRQLLELEYTGAIPATTLTDVIRIPTGDEVTPVLEIPFTVLPARTDS